MFRRVYSQFRPFPRLEDPALCLPRRTSFTFLSPPRSPFAPPYIKHVSVDLYQFNILRIAQGHSTTRNESTSHIYPVFFLKWLASSLATPPFTSHNAFRHAAAENLAAAAIRCPQPKQTSHPASAQEPATERQSARSRIGHTRIHGDIMAVWYNRRWKQQRQERRAMDVRQHPQSGDWQWPACRDSHGAGSQGGSEVDSED